MLLTVIAVSDEATSQEKDSPKTIFYCTGSVDTQAGRAPQETSHHAATSVLLEIEAERLVLLGPDTTSALNFIRVEQTGSQAVYHFGGISGEMVYKGTFSIPDFQLRVLGAGEHLEIEITMNCDRTSPLLLF
ncbi:MAG: hypothetical protein HOK98_04000 [Rhodospirillaceae bacterium]|nr:hypothetical protein [Rhodospirillaceae bacterium]